MKKKLASILMAIVCVFAIGFCALACGAESELNGTYYMWVNGSKVQIAYEFEDGDIKVAGVEIGEYSVSGKDVTIKSNNQSMTGKIISDGVIEFSENNSKAYYCLDGKTPPTEETDE